MTLNIHSSFLGTACEQRVDIYFTPLSTAKNNQYFVTKRCRKCRKNNVRKFNVWRFFGARTLFSLFWPLPVKGCKFWPMLGTHGHWAVRDLQRAYSDTGHPFIMVTSPDPWDSHLLPSAYQWSCHYLFLPLRSVAAFLLRGECSSSLRHRRGQLDALLIHSSLDAL